MKDKPISNALFALTVMVGLMTCGQDVRADYASAILQTSPVGYWRLGEASGTTAVDIAGGFNGTYGGTFSLGTPGLVTGANTAVTFSGVVGSGVTVPYTNSINPTNFTVEFWAMPATTAGAYVVALQDRTTGSRIGYAFQHHNFSSAWDFTFGVSPTSYNNISGTTVVQAGTVYHVAATYDGTTVSLYVNGVLENSIVTTYQPATSGVNLSFGSRNGNTPYNGVLDEGSDNAAVSGRAERTQPNLQPGGGIVYRGSIGDNHLRKRFDSFLYHGRQQSE
ncbi:MAG: LamG domain-containing protein [Verrucomicrobia bacterium]|nr:LamG domain-containing protein [Verrucomicrobiota bacterium]